MMMMMMMMIDSTALAERGADENSRRGRTGARHRDTLSTAHELK